LLNGGIVAGAPKAVTAAKLVGIAGRLTIGGKVVGESQAEDPCATLAWLADHVAERSRGLKAGMAVITGSLIPTVSIARGQRAVFTIEGLGDVAMNVVSPYSARIGGRIVHGDLAPASSAAHLKLDSANLESAGSKA